MVGGGGGGGGRVGLTSHKAHVKCLVKCELTFHTMKPNDHLEIRQPFIEENIKTDLS